MDRPDQDTQDVQTTETELPETQGEDAAKASVDASAAAGAEPGTPAENTSEAPDPGFEGVGLAPPVARAVAELGYETPTAIQRLCIPHLLRGRDLLGQAQTGTGKTAAFALPLLSRIDTSSKRPQVLVLTPTRELALQVAEAFQRYAQHLKGFHVLPIYGGQSYGLQVRQLQRVPQVVVGTPGRIMDHMRRDTLSLDSLATLVLDEADEMLDMGFAEDIDWIFEHTPPECQVALFSATMPPGILRVARDRLNDPVEVRVESATATVDTVEQRHCVVTRFHKVDMLTRILELNPFDGMLIFVRTKNETSELADKLQAQGFGAEPLNGDMNQEMRTRAVERLKGGQLDILVATDVAARGLDVERVSHVINYDIPTDPAAYVHRVGRTGRAGRTGQAILLVEPRERGLLKAIERAIRRRIPEMDPPSAEQISASRIDRFTQELRSTIAEQDLDFFYRLVSRIANEQELEPLAIAAALSFQIQRERPLEVQEPVGEAKPERGERRWSRESEEGRPSRGQKDREGFRTPRERGDRTHFGARDRGPYEGPAKGQGERPFVRPFERKTRRDDTRFGRDTEEGPRFERPLYDRGGDERPIEGRPARWEEGPRQRDRDGNREPRAFRSDRPERPRREDREPRRERDSGPMERRFEREPRDERPFRRDFDESRPRRDDRPPFEGRGENRPPRDDRPQRGERGGPQMVKHRIEVGHRDGVTPREIVGAIANESGLEGRFIGAIDIRDDYSTVDLPPGMPRELFSHLKRVFVRGRALRISVMEGPTRGKRFSPDDRPPPHRRKRRED